MSTKKLRGAQLRKFRSDVAKLKDKGLVSKRVDARRQRDTRYMRDQVKKYKDVLEGKAAVVKLKTHKAAKEYSGNYRAKFDKVVVPKKKGERVYATKRGEIRSTRMERGQRIRKSITKVTINGPDDFRKLEGPNVYFAVPFGNNSRIRFQDAQELITFMSGYDYAQWWNYVEIEYLSSDEDYGDDE